LEVKQKRELEQILTEGQKARLKEILAERSAPPSKDDKKPDPKPTDDQKKP
jgi:hypothetical protein